ncbi:sugar phosphate isomerase/epimerase [Pelagibacterium sp. H642]|uniref:sugar phosphate isomerase/epimerase family protein n=1 Tax=Pelagibacterium sp. H642 TaxID=1881069 RepID=UPI0028156640|nr:sugar phosphate isomerase/epimerase [Pelagibacterium sp. H642]WMT89224.1 sugar phosphate isomerase/epimerase [Pelagibacterium sp. H642]
MKKQGLLLSTAIAGFVVAAGAASVSAQDAAPEGDAALPIAVQMYTLRNFGSVEEQLAIVEEAGVSAVELVGTHDMSAEDLNGLLDAHGIEAVSAHVQLDALRSGIEDVIEFNKAVGNEVITVPYLAEEARPTDAEGWTALGEELEEFAGQLEAEGLQLAYHNHDFEMEEFDGQTALEVMFDAAPSVLAQLDVAWIDRAGLDAAEYIANFDGRLFAIHAKDNAPEGEAEEEDGWAAVGSGTIDWQAVLTAANDAGAQWYIIEHDNPADASATVDSSARFLEQELPGILGE